MMALAATLLGAPFLGAQRSYGAPDEQHGRALVVGDTPHVAEYRNIEDISKAVVVCSAGRLGAGSDTAEDRCLEAVREAAHRWLYTSSHNTSRERGLPTTFNTTRNYKLPTCHTCGASTQDVTAAPNCCSDGGAWEGLCNEGGQHTWDEGDQACQRHVLDVHPWRVLGDNWWMPFVDGWAHACGETVFDQSKTLTRLGDGEFSRHLKFFFDKFSNFDMLHKTRLTAGMVEEMAIELQGVDRASYGSWEPVSPYTDWQPRQHGDMMGYKGAVSVLDKEELFAHSMQTQDWQDPKDMYHKVRSALIEEPLKDFYEAVTKSDCGIYQQHEDSPKAAAAFTRRPRKASDWVRHPHPRAALGCLLPAAATLYATLAELHPFVDGNSRTRNMVLQTQLTRMGAHPLILYNNGWAAYHMNNLEELMQYFLGGYCAWEIVAKTGKSPYIGHSPKFDCATPPYENHTDMGRMGANTSPTPLYDQERDVCLFPATSGGSF